MTRYGTLSLHTCNKSRGSCNVTMFSHPVRFHGLFDRVSFSSRGIDIAMTSRELCARTRNTHRRSGVGGITRRGWKSSREKSRGYARGRGYWFMRRNSYSSGNMIALFSRWRFSWLPSSFFPAGGSISIDFAFSTSIQFVSWLETPDPLQRVPCILQRTVFYLFFFSFFIHELRHLHLDESTESSKELGSRNFRLEI